MVSHSEHKTAGNKPFTYEGLDLASKWVTCTSSLCLPFVKNAALCFTQKKTEEAKKKNHFVQCILQSIGFAGRFCGDNSVSTLCNPSLKFMQWLSAKRNGI